MTRVRIALVAAIACLAIGGTAVSDAVAAPRASGAPGATALPTLHKFHVTGASKSGKTFTGTYAIQRFVVAKVNGKRGVYAVGTLTGTLMGQHLTRSNVMLPARLSHGSALTTGTKSARAASCTILHLVLGPLNLNLLGLQITLGGGTAADQPIVLDLTAHQGQGLLGDLLCGIDNALSGTGVLSQLNSQLQSLATALNSITSLLGGL